MRTQTTSSCLIVQGDSIVLCRHLAGGYYFLPGGGHIGDVYIQNSLKNTTQIFKKLIG